MKALELQAVCFGSELGVEIPGPEGTIWVVWHGQEYGAELVWDPAGKAIPLGIWDENPKRAPRRNSGKVETEQPLEIRLEEGIGYAKQIHQCLATHKGIQPERFEFYVLTYDGRLSYRVDYGSQSTARRRWTQKRLDGGEDITV